MPLNYDLSEIKNQINLKLEKEAEIYDIIPDEITVGIFQISSKEIKNSIVSKHKLMSDKLKKLIYQIIQFNLKEAKNLKDKITKVLNEIPSDIRELTDLRKFMEDIPTQMLDLTNTIDNSFEMYEILDS